ncbi:MAG: NAD(+)/NADH kinase [Eubacteriales bacterium]|nr:NAD(+)/NADH kinase [Eubacteriales bacterium]
MEDKSKCITSFYIITNQLKDPDFTVTKKIMSYLLEHGAECQCQSPEDNVEGTGYRYTNVDLVPYDTQCIIVLGGDGTLIQAATELNHRNIPLMGVNIGTLGFLADADMNNVFDALEHVMQGNYSVDRRMMLDGKVYRGDELIYTNTALNDVVISRCGTLRVIDFDVYVNGTYLNSYSADGVIVSTATGSTAYSLSAGGPIIQPNAQLMMVTPICPHTMNQRSIIFSPSDSIEIVMTSNKKMSEERVATFDGELFCDVITGDRIVITRSDKVSEFIKTTKLSFLERIREKM